ncbi:MAG: class I SAM-dependent methyltransferase [Planctomycetes bacterium]|nr:class I SAM-dependent methyltransferase [Planctomycetota bacterium]
MQYLNLDETWQYPKDLKLEDVPCPYCAGRKDRVVTLGRDRLTDIPGKFQVVVCSECGLMRTNPRPTPQTIKIYYPNEYHPYNLRIAKNGGLKLNGNKSEVKQSLWKKVTNKYLNLDTRQIPMVKPGRLLDIGCSNGSFLVPMQKKGWDVEGLEFSADAAETARSLGLKIHVGAIEDVSLPTNNYDLITGWMILEHLHKPVEVLNKIRGWMKPNGWLAVSVPDARSCEFRVFGKRWYSLEVPRHLYHYTPNTLRKILLKSGWKIEKLLWHNHPKDIVASLAYHFKDLGLKFIEKYLMDIRDFKRHRIFYRYFGSLLGHLHASGRMTAWARQVK